MKLTEAYNALGIPQGSDEETAKKAFKRLASKWHPDVCKDDGAEERFKSINTAYERIKSGEPDESAFAQGGFGGINFGGFGINIEDLIGRSGGFGGFNRQPNRKPIQATDIHLTETISFRDSVLGCTKDLRFNRNVKCDDCDGSGQKSLDNGCDRCGGKGRIISQQNQFIHQSVCPKCHGQVAVQSCMRCSSNGWLTEEFSTSVRLPPGITNEKNVLRLGHCGNYAGSSMLGDQYTQGYLTVNITPQEGLSLEDNDVISSIEIDLLDALQGCVRSIPTIDGNKDAIIPEGTRNKEEIVLSNLGVARSGNQRLIVSVKYPDDTRKLIELLKNPAETKDEPKQQQEEITNGV